jgi:enamine deaminase RidA (YjgF/YER057c/UK114 family)
VQPRQAIANMLAILAAAGGAAQHLLKVTAYIVGVDNWPRFNAVYAAMLPDARPARTVVPVTELHHGYLVEIDAIALHLTAAAPSST